MGLVLLYLMNTFLPSINMHEEFFFLYLYDLDRTKAFIKHSDSAEINCADVRMDPEQTNNRSLGTTIIQGT